MENNAKENNKYYLSETSDSGWLKVSIDNLGCRFLCYGTKIKKIKIYKEFEYVKILDGPFRDFFSKVSLEGRGNSRFEKIDRNYKEKTTIVVYDNQRLSIKGLGEFSTVKIKEKFLKGTYFLEIPSHPHRKTPKSYLDKKRGGSRFAETWFRVVPFNNNKSDFFLHFGRMSSGCITINQDNSWDDIYNYLIRSRIDRLNIGTVTIK
jgi:hypothetical protein